MSACESQQVVSVRRYYLLEAIAADVREEFAIGDVFRAKQRAEPGTTLPDDFPSKAALYAAGYRAVEDINGADTDELVDAGLTTTQAKAVLSALAALL